MKTLSVLALALGSALFVGQANAYKYQVDAGYTHYDWDDSSIDQGDFSVHGTAYFEPIQVKNLPLQEAAFLTQSKNLYASYDYSYVDVTVGASEANADIHNFNAGFEYFNRTSGLYLNAGLGRATLKAEVIDEGATVSEGEANQTNYHAEIGFMPKNNLLFAAGITGSKASGNEDNASATLRTKYVLGLNETQFLNLEAAGEFGDTDQVNLNADFYFDQTWSVGAGYTLEDDGADDVDYFSIRTKKFFNPQVAIGAEVGFGDDLMTVGLEGTYRF